MIYLADRCEDGVTYKVANSETGEVFTTTAQELEDLKDRFRVEGYREDGCHYCVTVWDGVAYPKFTLTGDVFDYIAVCSDYSGINIYSAEDGKHLYSKVSIKSVRGNGYYTFTYNNVEKCADGRTLVVSPVKSHLREGIYQMPKVRASLWEYLKYSDFLATYRDRCLLTQDLVSRFGADIFSIKPWELTGTGKLVMDYIAELHPAWGEFYVKGAFAQLCQIYESLRLEIDRNMSYTNVDALLDIPRLIWSEFLGLQAVGKAAALVYFITDLGVYVVSAPKSMGAFLSRLANRFVTFFAEVSGELDEESISASYIDYNRELSVKYVTYSDYRLHTDILYKELLSFSGAAAYNEARYCVDLYKSTDKDWKVYGIKSSEIICSMSLLNTKTGNDIAFQALHLKGKVHSGTMKLSSCLSSQRMGYSGKSSTQYIQDLLKSGDSEEAEQILRFNTVYGQLQFSPEDYINWMGYGLSKENKIASVRAKLAGASPVMVNSSGCVTEICLSSKSISAKEVIKLPKEARIFGDGVLNYVIYREDVLFDINDGLESVPQKAFTHKVYSNKRLSPIRVRFTENVNKKALSEFLGLILQYRHVALEDVSPTLAKIMIEVAWLRSDVRGLHNVFSIDNSAYPRVRKNLGFDVYTGDMRNPTEGWSGQIHLVELSSKLVTVDFVKEIITDFVNYIKHEISYFKRKPQLIISGDNGLSVAMQYARTSICSSTRVAFDPNFGSADELFNGSSLVSAWRRYLHLKEFTMAVSQYLSEAELRNVLCKTWDLLDDFRDIHTILSEYMDDYFVSDVRTHSGKEILKNAKQNLSSDLFD